MSLSPIQPPAAPDPNPAMPLAFDEQLVRRRRARAAKTIDQHSFLLARVVDDFVDRISFIPRRFDLAVDVEASQGEVQKRFRDLPSVGAVASIEPVGSLLARSTGLQVCGSLAALPIRDASVDLVTSVLSLQQVNDLPGALVQIRRALKPDGLFLGAMFGGATLTELRQAFLAAETECEGGASPRVAPFADVKDLGGLLQRAGFALPVTDIDTVDVAYASALHLMRDLRGMGLTNALVQRRRTFLRRRTLARVCEIYQERFARPDGRVRATFEIITLTGWAPHPDQQKPLKPGSAKTSLAKALGVDLRSGGQ
jgi:NADH dehydrogenase [ubiquinone] 1 alpha subcomplex assembly factor 5